MLKLPESVLSPFYAVAVVIAVALVAWPLSYCTRFYRNALRIEDRTRLTPLDGLRGILCFAVMMHHAACAYGYYATGAWDLPPSKAYVLMGQTSVALFFCVTAYLFWGRAVAKNGEIETGPFLVGRVFRIVPLYVFSCLVAVAVLARHLDWLSLATFKGLAPIGMLGLRPWNGFGTPDAFSVNAAVTWSLQYEWGFYLVLPALAMAVRGSGLRVGLLAAGVIVMFGASPAAYFLPGVLAVYVARSAKWSASMRHPATSAAVVLMVIAMPKLIGVGYGLRGLLPVAAVFVPIACGNSIFGLLNLRSLRLMGLISYSVYLLHGVCLYVSGTFLRAAGAAGQPAWSYWLTVAACAGGVLVLCLATYRWVEWPFIAFEKRLRNRPATERLIRQQNASVPAAV